jgi:phage gpG-like protein
LATNYQVDPDKAFQSAIKDALKQVSDLTIPFTLITKSWFKGNASIFALKGPGKYEDLTEKYKERKKADVGFIYPILKRSGLLAKSITQAGDSNSINYIINKKTLVLGTKVSYGPVHQFGSTKRSIPKRPFILIGAEQVSPPEINRRREAWIAILEDYVRQVSGKFSTPKS